MCFPSNFYWKLIFIWKWWFIILLIIYILVPYWSWHACRKRRQTYESLENLLNDQPFIAEIFFSTLTLNLFLSLVTINVHIYPLSMHRRRQNYVMSSWNGFLPGHIFFYGIGQQIWGLSDGKRYRRPRTLSIPGPRGWLGTLEVTLILPLY